MIDFSIYRAIVLANMVCMGLWLAENLHIFDIMDDHVLTQIEIVKSKISYYAFCSVWMICFINAMATRVANLEGTTIL